MNALKITSLLLVICCEIGSACAAEGADDSKTLTPSTQMESEKSADAVCPNQDSLNPSTTPNMLSKALTACINTADFDTAVTMYALLGTYGRFDSMRVTDVTAHQAGSLMQMFSVRAAFAEPRVKFQQLTEAILGDDVRRQALCEKVRQIGMPAYYPKYMVQHGMSVYTGTSQTIGGLDQRWRRNSEQRDKWKLCGINPGPRPENAG